MLVSGDDGAMLRMALAMVHNTGDVAGAGGGTWGLLWGYAGDAFWGAE